MKQYKQNFKEEKVKFFTGGDDLGTSMAIGFDKKQSNIILNYLKRIKDTSENLIIKSIISATSKGVDYSPRIMIKFDSITAFLYSAQGYFRLAGKNNMLGGDEKISTNDEIKKLNINKFINSLK